MKIFALLSGFSVAVADIAGTVKVTYDTGGKSVKFKGDVTGLPKNLKKAGIHVHVGTDCTNKDTIGGHLFSNYVDGWVHPAAVTYDTDANGKAKIDVKAKSFAFENSTDAKGTPNLLGRCIVLHGLSADKPGDRVAVAKIVKEGDKYCATLGKYPESAITTTPAGKLALTITDTDCVKITGDVTGLGKNLKGVGFHVHTGTDCTGGSEKDKVNTVIGGHLFSKGDAFKETVYTTDDKGKATIDISTIKASHILLAKDKAGSPDSPPVENHCIVLHDDVGKRIGVAKIVCDKDGKCEAKAGPYPGTETKTEKKELNSVAKAFLGMSALVISTVVGFF